MAVKKATEEQRQILLEAGALGYCLRRHPRRQRRLSLLVSPRGDVEVRAPVAARQSDIDALLRRHEDWLWQCRERAAKQDLPRAPQQSGDRIFYLGQTYTLQLVEGRGGRLDEAARILELAVSDHRAETVQAALQRWYRRRAEQYLEARLSAWAAQASWLTTLPPLRLRRMRSRWGSCSQRAICLNTRLMMAPPQCIDMVIVHELCHLREMNHSPAFYALMSELMPDWQQHSEHLDELTRTLMLD
ncbi:SprT family zinc-dependent metalloprotease [Spongiibacter tropicus]|uniref:M48 family metallopeptidase n=1 Tax=Spongiibacter tropicus TaxID=454602 RepID=UPI0023556D9E|nr:SprT family zinc-dependent metalloprotease [Spongiibacter tropicus]